MKSKMKKSIITLAMAALAVSVMLSPATSYASSLFGGSFVKPQSNTNTVQTLINANNEVGLSYNLLNQYYTENTGDNESGNISGIGVSLTSLSNVLSIPLIYEHLAYTNNWGSFNYTDSGNGENATDNTDMVDITARVGRAFLLGSKTMLIPYLAYNYRNWDRNLGNGVVGNTEYLGYQEVYNYNALGIGVLGEYAINNALVLKGRLQYSKMIGNSMNAYNIPYIAGGQEVSTYPTMNFNLKNEPVYTVGVGVDYDIANTHLHAIAGIKYTRTTFGESDVNTDGYYEPNSMTDGMNYTVGLAYSF